MLSDKERDYLKTQRLARVATVSPGGAPEVSPVGFEFDGKYFWIGSNSQKFFPTTRRYRNIAAGNTRIALVVDDVVAGAKWAPRGIKVSGTAEVMEHDGIFGKGRYIRVKPNISASWGIEEPTGYAPPSVKKWE